MGERIRFYLDEHIPKAVADGLRRRGIEVTRAQEVGLRRGSDQEHLEFARRENHVVVTKDSDFLRFNREGVSHNGIVYLDRDRTIGEILNALELIAETLSPEDLRDHIEYW
jgi:predicted nuclease of predicted toxin-antitoxin system